MFTLLDGVVDPDLQAPRLLTPLPEHVLVAHPGHTGVAGNRLPAHRVQGHLLSHKQGHWGAQGGGVWGQGEVLVEVTAEVCL